MSEQVISQVWRLPIYAYLEELWRGRRVLEMSCGTGESAAFMARYGAAAVVGVDDDRAAIDHARHQLDLTNVEFRAEPADAVEAEDASFDCVVVPDALAALRTPSILEEVRRLLRPEGVLIACGHSAEYRGGGASFSLLESRLGASFAPVQMLGASPFSGLGLVAFAGNGLVDDEVPLEVDSRLVADGEPIEAYVAVCGPAQVPKSLTVVQVASAEAAALLDIGVRAPSAGGRSGSLTIGGGRAAEVDELRRRVRALEDEVAAAASGPSQSQRIAEALAAHMSETEDLQERLREVTAWSAELEAALEEARSFSAELEGRLAEALRGRAELEEKNRELRSRAAIAEGRAQAAELRAAEEADAEPAPGPPPAPRTGPEATLQELSRQLAARETEIMLLTAGVEGLRGHCARSAAELRALIPRLAGDGVDAAAKLAKRLDQLGTA